MNDDRQLGGACHLHLLNENALLHVARRMVVVVIEADLAPGDHLGFVREPCEFVEICLLCQCRFVRMNARQWRTPSRIAARASPRNRASCSRTIAVADGEQR